uniref:Pectinesterase inhibitor domain-containing protein n=1 Tax=Fagus sylvatica TaxID=28930 RepID=A0A2N9GTR2_FAGSY
MNPISKLFLVILLTICPHQILAKEGSDFIVQACDHTLYKALCVKTLQSDPESHAAANIHILAKVVLKHAASEANQILDQITKLHGQTSDQVIEQCLSDCSENYQDAIDQVEDAQLALESNGYDDLNTWITAAMSDADSCEQGFNDQPGHKSPITDLNNTFSQLCSIVLALTNQLRGH